MKAISNGGTHQSPRPTKWRRVAAVAGALIILGVVCFRVRELREIAPTEPEVSQKGPEAVQTAPAEEQEYTTNEDPDMLPYTETDLELLTIAIYVEAGSDSCSDETRIMVGNVIQNRVASEDFPDTMYEVLVQKGQFNTFYWDGITWPDRATYETGAVERAYECARRVLSGEKLLPDDVVWMAEFPQGNETVVYQDGIYFCRG